MSRKFHTIMMHTIMVHRWGVSCHLVIGKPEPNMLKILLIIPSSISQKLLILILSQIITYVLFPYYSFTLMFQVCIDF